MPAATYKLYAFVVFDGAPAIYKVYAFVEVPPVIVGAVKYEKYKVVEIAVEDGATYKLDEAGVEPPIASATIFESVYNPLTYRGIL